MSAAPLSVLLVLDGDRTPADVVGTTRTAAAALAEHGHVRLTVVEEASALVSGEGASVVHAVGPTALAAAQRVLAGRAFPALVSTVVPPRRPGLGRLAARLPVRRQVDRWVVHGSRAAAALVESGRLRADRIEVVPLLPLTGAGCAATWEARRRQARDALGVVPGCDVVVGMGRPEAEPAFRWAAAELARSGVLAVWLDPDAGTGWSWRGGQATRVTTDPVQLLPAMDLLVGLGSSGRARSASVDAWRAGVPVLATGDDDGATLVALSHPALLLRRPDRRQVAAAALALTSRYPVTRRPGAERTWHRVNGTVEPLARALLASYSAALGLPQHLVPAGVAQ
jgi:hypothetical protein